jgi:hypothetical protein
MDTVHKMEPIGIILPPMKPTEDIIPTPIPVELPETPPINLINDNVSILDLLKEWSIVKIKTRIINFLEGNNMAEPVIDIKSTVVGIIVRLLLKVGGGVLVTLGVTEGSLTLIITAIATIAVGVFGSWWNNRKLLASIPAK